MTQILRVLTLLVVIVLLAGCSGDWIPRKWKAPRLRLPEKGPVDVFIDIIDQVRGIGRGITRQFQGFGRSVPGR